MPNVKQLEIRMEIDISRLPEFLRFRIDLDSLCNADWNKIERMNLEKTSHDL